MANRNDATAVSADAEPTRQAADGGVASCRRRYEARRRCHAPSAIRTGRSGIYLARIEVVDVGGLGKALKMSRGMNASACPTTALFLDRRRCIPSSRTSAIEVILRTPAQLRRSRRAALWNQSGIRSLVAHPQGDPPTRRPRRTGALSGWRPASTRCAHRSHRDRPPP